MQLNIKFTTIHAEEVYQNREKPLNWKNGDSGIDLSFVSETEKEVTIEPNETKLIKTGVCCQLKNVIGSTIQIENDDREIQVRGRSGLNSKGILTHFGTVDYGYTGEIGVVMTNLSGKPITFKEGERIAQIVVAPIFKPEICFVSSLEQTERGNEGFGSTGL